MLPGMVCYWDRDLTCRFANKSYRAWFGGAAEIVGLPMREVVGAELCALNEPYARSALGGKAQRFERVLTRADGGTVAAWYQFEPDIDAQRVVAGFFVLISDISDVKAATANCEITASVYEHTSEAIVVTDESASILSVNPAFTELTGYTAAEAVGQRFALWRAVTANGRWQGELWNRRKDGASFLQWQTITKIGSSSGAAVRYLAVFSDITEMRRRSDRFEHLAYHDSLTDLPNRALLMDRLAYQIAVAERDHGRLAVMLLDLDGFKDVNDRYGHDIGDELLKTVAAKLGTLVRRSDTVARLGGDEFVVVLFNPESEAEVSRIATGIIAALNARVDVRGRPLEVGTSIGIAMYPTHGRVATDLVRHADIAMYSAKNAGKNRVRSFDPTLTPPTERERRRDD